MGLGRVDRYELLALIGQGGFGGVYRAVHVHTGQMHALKLARDTVDPDATARALAEARMAGSLRHPNVIGVIDGGIAATGEAFVVMELLEGRTLAQAIEREAPFPVMRAARIARQMLEGLAAAHAAGIVHRDVKPSNVFLIDVGDGAASNEVVKVIDFGISKVRAAGAAAVAMTLPGVAIGTPGYMAPEQLGDARSVDPRADLYAVGVVMFEMLTKRRPIEPDGLETWMQKLMHERAPSLATVAPHVPRPLAEVVDRALARDVDARWPSASAMRAALDASLADVSVEGFLPTVNNTPGAVVRGVTPSHAAPAVAQSAWPTPAYAPPPGYSGSALHGLSHPPPHGLVHAPPPSRGSGSGVGLYLVFGALVVLIGLLAAFGMGLFWFLSRGSSDAALASEPAAAAPPAAPISAPPVATTAGEATTAAAAPPQGRPAGRPAAAKAAAPPGAPALPGPAPAVAPPAAAVPAAPQAAGGPTISAPRIVGALRQDAFFALARRARSSIDQCNGARAAMVVKVDIMIAQDKITIAQPSVNTNPGDPLVARCAAQALKDAQFAGFAPGASGIYQEAVISWK